MSYEVFRHGEEEDVGVGNADDNTHEEGAYGHHVDEEVVDDENTYTLGLQEVHFEDDSAEVEVRGMDTLQH